MNSLTVYFEDPFWVGVFERQDGNHLKAAKVIFGAEPSDAEVFRFIQTNYHGLEFSASVTLDSRPILRPNPKRLQRQVARSVQTHGVGTKAQQALKQQRELAKTERKCKSKEERLAEAERRFTLAKEKRKEKHKGH